MREPPRRASLRRVYGSAIGWTMRKLTSCGFVLRYYSEKTATFTLGRAYVSRPAAALRRYFGGSIGRPRFSGKAALVAHIYYPELLDEIIDCFLTLPEGSDLILTTPADRAFLVESTATKRLTQRDSREPGVRIVPVANRGRDIAPFLELLNSGSLSYYDAVLKIHTKRSPHLLDGEIRRKLLFTMLAGSRRRTNEILKLFEDTQTGLVGWRLSWRSAQMYWMQNNAHITRLCREMDCAVPLVPSFFEGSMFWLRPAALTRLAALRIETEAFEAEAGQTDGALHHALERVFPLACAAAGYVARDVTGRVVFPRAKP